MPGDLELAARPLVVVVDPTPLPEDADIMPLPVSTKRILLVSHAAELGGAELGLLDVARHFGSAHCDALMFTDGPLRPLLEACGVVVQVLGADPRILGVRRQGGILAVLRALPATLLLSIRLARVAKPYGLIYANSQKAALTAMLAGFISRRPVLWHLHDILSADHFSWLQRRAVATLSNPLARAVIVVSAAGRAALIASGGDPSRISIIHNGIDAAPYRGVPEMARSLLRAKHRLPSGRLVGLFGRITPWKGQRVLIEALPLMPDLHVLIVGSAMFGQDAELAFVQSLAQTLGVADRVLFLGYRADTAELMRAVDLVVHCSTAPEPFGRVIVEALFAGTPILAAEGGASTEILGDEPGWCIPPGDPNILAGAIDAFFARDAKTQADRMHRMRMRVINAFSLARMMSAIDALVIRLTC